jgi:enamine deaminase RidA (YjgF/YER057c/UK114 family)
MIRSLAAGVALSLIGCAAFAAPGAVTHTYAAPEAPIASAVFAPAGVDTLYVSGTTGAPLTPATPGVPATYGNTEQQTDSALTRIEGILKAQGFGPGDVVKMTVYLVGDPTNGGKMDFAGMMAAYKRHYGTADQPNRPARTTVQVASLAGPGALVEIEVVAARKPAS